MAAPKRTAKAPESDAPAASAAQPDTAPAEAPVNPPTDEELTVAAPDHVNRILRYHVWAAMGVGLVPVPIADLVAFSGVQANLLRVLAKLYHVPFRKGIVRNILSALVGGVIPVTTAPLVASSVSKIVPAVGQTAGVVTMPIIAGATTYALGKVFIQHFASGGTFLTFDPEQVKDYYADMFAEGQNVAENLRAQ